MTSTLLKCAALTILTTLFYNCKKDEKTETPTPPPLEEQQNYSALKPGNYWIYGRFELKADGSAIRFGATDSCYVEKDTSIRNALYHKYWEYDFVFNRSFVSYLRDSADCLVSSNGSVIMSWTNFNTALRDHYVTDTSNNDTVLRQTQQMTEKDIMIEVPAGNFNSSTLQTRIIYYATGGMTPATSITQFLKTRYCKYIGIISKTEQPFINSSLVTERRLLRYKTH